MPSGPNLLFSCPQSSKTAVCVGRNMSNITCAYLLNRTCTIVRLLTPNAANAELLHNQHNALGARKHEFMPFGPNLLFLGPQPSTTDDSVERNMSHLRCP